KVEVFFKQSALVSYFQAIIERLSPQTRTVAERIIQSLNRHHSQWPSSTATPSDATMEQVLSDTLYTEAIALNYATRQSITTAMEQVIGQILSCPYQGATRRAYLEKKALELVRLRLNAMTQPRLKGDELDAIYQAAAILREQVKTPPTIEVLARQVSTNRLKLNQGFRQVFGTTPFGYLRDCRIWQARWQLVMSERSVNEVAASVGYTSRSRFATAFRQRIGVNPKAFQMQAWQWLVENVPAKKCV
ncbi:MAG: helix-turn-helix transcriptional regulator, partial [Merismopedia sp. SIO2A8]|nr:helix-turn-helix transcriptional regulator [Merismopedia sp. SIO2A8]